jgi:hypothetical protein
MFWMMTLCIFTGTHCEHRATFYSGVVSRQGVADLLHSAGSEGMEMQFA